MDYGKLIKAEREKRGMSKYALAKSAGVTETAIRHWENGERNSIGIDYADRVFKALGITVTLGVRGEA